mmetsp:Transcript_12061/g.34491  ORF Transcript_12061/g.34491 Transcript_12061/m.34491 type:complete len:219 (-) Transcript_12061:212-868(-)|eukprot:CAMPEP_0181019964 /NCGR_PEP_ID=MMETSP1070-20121207/197_1 /TAXON_ID=265543 /ORGANISM="Minutocellus polymorphus, Strain NH13" /LENGTH=218 /DNA_ID=CAMNT_0023096745 /DNA_START=90 /DNA_END=746 /DNA_ORIENTATION=+
MKSFSSVPVLALILLLLAPSAVVSQDQLTCNRNGGGMTVWEDRTCDTLNYTFTEWCNVVDTADGNCQVTAKSCGCKYYDETGYASSVGSGSKHCANACVDISSDVPVDGSCNAQGSAVSWEGRCDSKNYTFTPQCSFRERTDSQNNVLECFVEAKGCGCLWWEDDSDYISGVNHDGRRSCDACAVYGMGNDLPSNGSAALGFAGAFAAIVFGALSMIM